ncbi:ABC transporter permease [Ensifer sp. ENS03]|uniref:ABC transporter permease n=1 Tax=Ensifer sp. ENS03 TaxID=2769283 RepID=UPI003530366D
MTTYAYPEKAKDPTTIRYALAQKTNVMKAVMLRDMRTRFFNHGLGFLVVSLWPLGHMFVLLLIYTMMGRKSPFGDSLNVFFLTGLIPTLTFMYVSRFMSYSIILNKPMLAFPAVTMIDIVFARAFLEIIAACLTAFFAFSLLALMGENPYPFDIVEAAYAFLATLLLAVGIGSLCGVISMFFEFFVTLYALFLIIIYISSGTLFVAASMPSQLAEALAYNPVFQCVEWMRSAYFESYSRHYVDKGYLLSWGAGSLCLGLLLERLLRRRMLEG